MTDPKPEPPVHRISRVEDRDRILAEALAHAEAQDSQYRVLPPSEPVRGQWKTPVAVAAFVVAAWIGLFPPDWLAGCTGCSREVCKKYRAGGCSASVSR